LESIYDTQSWLREYHSSSTAETVNPTLKRLFVVPLMKKLVERKATELLAGVVACNIRQLVYPKYTKGIDIDIQPVPQHAGLVNWMSR
jgi:tRNA(His) 5'-end guanylyltransferase